MVLVYTDDHTHCSNSLPHAFSPAPMATLQRSHDLHLHLHTYMVTNLKMAKPHLPILPQQREMVTIETISLSVSYHL